MFTEGINVIFSIDFYVTGGVAPWWILKRIQVYFSIGGSFKRKGVST